MSDLMEPAIIRSVYPDPSVPEDVSFPDFFLRIIESSYHDSVAMVDPETDFRLTYSELVERVNRMRNALTRIGILSGDVIGTFVGNSADFICFTLAAIGIGAIVAPINPACKNYEVMKYFCEANVKWAVVEERYYEKLCAGVALQSVQATIVLDAQQTTFQTYGFQGFLNEPHEKPTIETAVIASDPALIFFSSGTTGPPKGVVLSNRSLLATVEIVRVIGAFRRKAGIKGAEFELPVLGTQDRVYGILPYFHAGGLLSVYCMLMQGVQLVVNRRRFDAQQFLQICAKYRVTTLNLVPPVLNFLLESLCKSESAKQQLSSVKQIFVGAAAIRVDIMQALQQHLPQTHLIELYGMTEAGVMIFMHPIGCARRDGSCGQPIAGVQCKVVAVEDSEIGKEKDKKDGDEDEEVCGPGKIGEILLKTSTMMSAYLSTDDSKQSLTADGWFRTGDLGYYDSEGFFYITGRKKEMIKVRGWQVSPYEIEELLQQFEQIEQCAVIGIPDPESGQLPRAYIKLRQGTEPLGEDDIHRMLKEKLISYKQLAGGIEFVENLPMTSSGKLARHELLQIFLSKKL